ncbi:hypothetical protein NKI66_20920 [Mesorhizobium sp. M0518]|uniref:hypothetical protein n=1 Tax=Mesorhizobium sp. M0518 TaxID=2956956 RepID=UPI00333DEFA5
MGRAPRLWRSSVLIEARTSQSFDASRSLTALEQDNHFAVIEMWARDIEVYAIHPARVAGSRDHRRAKTDRLDT